MFNYQFNYFFRNGFAESKPEKIGEFMLAFDNKFLPMFLDEMTPVGVNKILRMVGMERYSNISVHFGSEVLSIHVNSKDDEMLQNSEIFELLSFVYAGLNKINKSKRSYRVSTVISSIAQYSEEYNNELYLRFFPSHNPNDFFEWNARMAKKDKVKSESINSIATVSRAMLMSPDFNSGRPSDAIAIEIDINTIAENGDVRFSFDVDQIMSSMFDFAKDRYSELAARG